MRTALWATIGSHFFISVIEPPSQKGRNMVRGRAHFSACISTVGWIPVFLVFHRFISILTIDVLILYFVLLKKYFYRCIFKVTIVFVFEVRKLA